MRILYWFLHRIFPQLVFYVEKSDLVYITIDDSPSPNTNFILDILEQYQVKASFFCVGKNIELYPEQFEDIRKRGHIIGYHSYSHLNAWRREWSNIKNDTMKNISQYKANIYRPPYGKLSWKLYHLLSPQYKIVLWDILTEDWKQDIAPLDKISRKINRLKKGSIVVFHDNNKSYNNIQIMLPYFLEYLKEKEIKTEVLTLNNFA